MTFRKVCCDPMRDAEASALLRHARDIAERDSLDPSTKVACLLIVNNTIVSTGVNAMCRGHANTQNRWERPAKYVWVVHAEINAVANAARAGVCVDGATCVITLFPCVACCKALIQSGVVCVVTVRPDFNDPKWGAEFVIATEMLRESNVTIQFVE